MSEDTLLYYKFAGTKIPAGKAYLDATLVAGAPAVQMIFEEEDEQNS